MATDNEILEQAEQIKKKQAAAQKAAKTRKKKGLYSKFIILSMIIYAIYFTERVLHIAELTGQQAPDSLIAAVMAFCLGEIVSTAIIKVTKVKKGE